VQQRVPPIVREVLSSGGTPLDAGMRAFMEPRFGQDFSRVRIHTDVQAIESTRAVHARAFTMGRDVVFASGQYAPQTDAGRRLLAHELTHVVQQGGPTYSQSGYQISSPDDRYEQEAESAAGRILQNEYAGSASPPIGATGPRLQRDLATGPPAEPAADQPDLTPEQIRAAINFNAGRHDAANTRLIQDLLGGPVTGVWSEDNIVAIAATQEQYGLHKDGLVGPNTFRFLNNEQRLEGMSIRTADCLTSFLVNGPDRPTVRRTPGNPTQCDITGHFRTESQFSSRCNCAQFQYRQFIGGHFRRERTDPATGAVTITDMSGDFAALPGGRLTEAFQEDGDVNDNPVNYGHRDQPADADPEDHYLNDRGADDQANGCRYRNEDGPHDTNINDCQAGDIYDADMGFRGEIQRNGAAIETRRWSAIRGRFVAPP
jgi:hypothetical protein